jgi:hypothetical protein
MPSAIRDIAGGVMTENDDRPVFVLHLQAKLHVGNPIANLRALLKAALRRFHLRCVHCSEISTQTAAAFQKLRDDVAKRTGSPPARPGKISSAVNRKHRRHTDE